jgi:phosphoglucosamine mutase
MATNNHKRLFGTDGIRGRAGVPPLDPTTVHRVGSSLVEILSEREAEPRILLGRDTRESGQSLAEDLGRGIAAAGGHAVCMGVVPTPGIAALARARGFDAGVMISASHNPYQDNGIKILSAEGFKLPDRQEARIEARVLDGSWPEEGGGQESRLEHHEELVGDYLEILRGAVEPGLSLASRRVHLDCAHGAAYRIAADLFRSLGAEVQAHGVEPDGRNINLDCGALHPQGLAEAVRADGADFGVAFDGDADRAILVDRTGSILDGDFVLYRSALDLHGRGLLRGNCVVATVMSNLWLERALRSHGIDLRRAQVGDKYVLEEMQRCGAVLGGEQSGHIIFLDHATTGDGLLTALKMAENVVRNRGDLARWNEEIRPCPQILLNVPVSSRPDLETHPSVGPVITSVARDLGERGRVLVRYSGTENLARVMVEGEEAGEIDEAARRICTAIEEAIG